ncbi:glyceraldehyde 3-phosphate dehydrogenase NAD-binding domain-containing protein [Streptomyces sp. CB02923]|uniref:glyceraldehyde 3-phosphate dehydrogenase NAD-binding domain-containing protein n=1 Tax=Streptomyces sp. CB02923 TaxID=1718985 RepID=UPI003FD15D8E
MLAVSWAGMVVGQRKLAPPAGGAPEMIQEADQDMVVRVGINGFGRIGRNCLRCVLERVARQATAVEVVAVNDVASAGTLTHLLEYDSTYGRFGLEVGTEDGALVVAGRRIAVCSEPDPAALDCSVLPVTDSAGIAAGLVSARQINRVPLEDRPLTTLRDIMRPLAATVTVSFDEPADDLLPRLQTSHE